MLLTTCQCEDRKSCHSPHLSVYSYERRIQILDIVFLFPHSQALKTVVIEAHTHAETRKKRDKWITGWCCYFLLRPSFSLSFLHFFASSVCAHVLCRNLTGFPGIIFFFSFFLANWLVSVRPILPSHEPTNGLSVCLSVCSIVLLPACLVCLSVFPFRVRAFLFLVLLLQNNIFSFSLPSTSIGRLVGCLPVSELNWNGYSEILGKQVPTKASSLGEKQPQFPMTVHLTPAWEGRNKIRILPLSLFRVLWDCVCVASWKMGKVEGEKKRSHH